jgi:hypothetical protein
MENKPRPYRPHAAALLGCLLCLLTGFGQADDTKDFGQYVVHFNALPTDLLPARVAREFHITRHNNRGMVNITVLRKLLGSPGQPVHAFVDVTGTSQAGQSWQIPVREVREGKAIYYIGEFGIKNGETINFDVRVRPQGTPDTLQLEFSQTFHAG